MGWFSGFLGKVGGAFKSAGRTIVKKTKETVQKVKQGVTNTWANFTGKNTFKEAEELYERIASRYNQRRAEFDRESDKLMNQIHQHVQAINGYKSRIKTELFVEMANNLEKIKDIEFDKTFKLDHYKNGSYQFEAIRTKNQLYQIDFNKNKFKVTMQAIFTLGFYTRKKAIETLYEVQIEEQKVEAEIKKMDAEIVKLSKIEVSLRNVTHYFSSTIELYEQLLVRLDNSVHYLYFRCMQFAHKIIQKEMSIKRLPLIQQKELEAVMIASSILKKMTETQFVSFDQIQEIQAYENTMNQSQKSVEKAFNAA
jgi:hypothetical protein